MATAVLGHWPGMTEAQYARAVERINRDEEFPAGMLLHTSGFTPDGLRVFDIWESEKDYKQFLQRRITPALRQEGYKEAGQVTFFPLHNVYLSGLEKLREMGMSMLPS